jgi:hypothetical protein
VVVGERECWIIRMGMVGFPRDHGPSTFAIKSSSVRALEWNHSAGHSKGRAASSCSDVQFCKIQAPSDA